MNKSPEHMRPKESFVASKGEMPSPPDPGPEVTLFLAWLRKRSGGIKKLAYCKQKWGPKGLDIEKIVARIRKEGLKLYGDDLITIAPSPGKIGGGEDYVWLTKAGGKWADKWIRLYDEAIPHHTKWKPLETKNSVKKRKV
jgi:hypothetical protein